MKGSSAVMPDAALFIIMLWVNSSERLMQRCRIFFNTIKNKISDCKVWALISRLLLLQVKYVCPKISQGGFGLKYGLCQCSL